MVQCHWHWSIHNCRVDFYHIFHQFMYIYWNIQKYGLSFMCGNRVLLFTIHPYGDRVNKHGSWRSQYEKKISWHLRMFPCKFGIPHWCQMSGNRITLSVSLHLDGWYIPYYNMTVWIWVGIDVNFPLAMGLIKLDMPIVQYYPVMKASTSHCTLHGNISVRFDHLSKSTA